MFAWHNNLDNNKLKYDNRDNLLPSTRLLIFRVGSLKRKRVIFAKCLFVDGLCLRQCMYAFQCRDHEVWR